MIFQLSAHRFSPLARGVAFLVLITSIVGLASAAQGKKKNPTSKVYVADVMGDAQIDTGERIQDLAKRSVYNAEGTAIETKPAERPEDIGKTFSTMVYSNGTGAFFDADTRVEVRRFLQEPFTPNRSDFETEPSISQTQAFVARGTVGICASKLVAGSSMNYQTSHGSVNIRGRKVVIETNNDVTKISMLEGDSTVRAGEMDLGGHTIKAGEQAIIRPGAPGQPNNIEISKIPESETARLDEKVTMACAAKKTVYFELKEKPATEVQGGGQAAPGDEGAPGGPITAFDDAAGDSTGEIVPIQVVPIELPTQFTETPARAPVGG